MTEKRMTVDEIISGLRQLTTKELKRLTTALYREKKGREQEEVCNNIIRRKEESGEWVEGYVKAEIVVQQLDVIMVKPSDYEVYGFISGHFGISKKGAHGGECVHGGDSANEDDYNEEYMKTKLEEWDGTLHYTGDRYGYKIEK